MTICILAKISITPPKSPGIEPPMQSKLECKTLLRSATSYCRTKAQTILVPAHDSNCLVLLVHAVCKLILEGTRTYKEVLASGGCLLNVQHPTHLLLLLDSKSWNCHHQRGAPAYCYCSPVAIAPSPCWSCCIAVTSCYPQCNSSQVQHNIMLLTRAIRQLATCLLLLHWCC